jgi:hypothetical protein
MEIAPKLVNLPGLGHSFDDFDRISRLPLLAQVIPSQDLRILHLAHAIKMINNPFVELITPVHQSMS